MENSLTQFSIYKIDYDCFKNIDGSEHILYDRLKKDEK